MHASMVRTQPGSVTKHIAGILAGSDAHLPLGYVGVVPECCTAILC